MGEATTIARTRDQHDFAAHQRASVPTQCALVVPPQEQATKLPRFIPSENLRQKRQARLDGWRTARWTCSIAATETKPGIVAGTPGSEGGSYACEAHLRHRVGGTIAVVPVVAGTVVANTTGVVALITIANSRLRGVRRPPHRPGTSLQPRLRQLQTLDAASCRGRDHDQLQRRLCLRMV